MTVRSLNLSQIRSSPEQPNANPASSPSPRPQTKTIVAGLKMVNHSVGQDQIQGQSEEYRRFHGQEYEQEFRQQYPKLYNRLSNIKNVQQWNQYSQYN